jgi:preprotein translocase subunit SecG
MAALSFVLILLTCIALIFAVLVQNPKGGLTPGLSYQVIGVRRATNIIEKATWTLGVLLFVFSVGATVIN